MTDASIPIAYGIVTYVPIVYETKNPDNERWLTTGTVPKRHPVDPARTFETADKAEAVLYAFLDSPEGDSWQSLGIYKVRVVHGGWFDSDRSYEINVMRMR